ncbi:NifB/NifX family molybdenum-iron cluster-binding protein [Shewanella livingstonensis]|uniref:Dinitrogenase iron-molybdenum cofactor biosynthesis domain-containing protein n=1 Tax=Shewanella livingstonensis TaxID=150120 RepID=A0A3G8LVG3_9GAMM|nr:NifB/NifX family molybdenum-iron cluster-binding protein [Shewanella livingstonensis]AZG73374.1 hypothetical protein EGC82_11735 [Shewanella livingstonensis]
MITAIPMKAENISSHFSKADEILFIDVQAQVIGRFANPALLDGCEGKQQLVSLLLAQGANRVIVRNIGQQLLSTLLSQQLMVFHANNGRTAIESFAGAVLADCEQYTQASQGRPSTKHIAKQADGGSCGHHHDHDETSSQNGQCNGSEMATKTRCCDAKVATENTIMKSCCHKINSLIHQH